MKRKVWFGFLILVLATTTALAAIENRWLHVRVDEQGGDEEHVSVNIPLQMVANILPLIELDEFRRGVIIVDDADFEEIDLRGILQELRNAPDAEFVTVKTNDEMVRVAKEGGFLLVNVEEGDSERVRVRMPMDVVDALLTGERNELNVAAAVQALGNHTEGDLITVEDGDSTVRIWIDFSQTGE